MTAPVLLAAAARAEVAAARRLRTDLLPRAEPEHVAGILRAMCDSLHRAATIRAAIRAEPARGETP